MNKIVDGRKLRGGLIGYCLGKMETSRGVVSNSTYLVELKVFRFNFGDLDCSGEQVGSETLSLLSLDSRCPSLFPDTASNSLPTLLQSILLTLRWRTGIRSGPLPPAPPARIVLRSWHETLSEIFLDGDSRSSPCLQTNSLLPWRLILSRRILPDFSSVLLWPDLGRHGSLSVCRCLILIWRTGLTSGAARLGRAGRGRTAFCSSTWLLLVDRDFDKSSGILSQRRSSRRSWASCRRWHCTIEIWKAWLRASSQTIAHSFNEAFIRLWRVRQFILLIFDLWEGSFRCRMMIEK